MKNIIIFSAVLFALIGCQKNEMPIYLPGDTTHGIFHACRNGEDWTASGWAKRYADKNNFFYITGNTFTEDSFLREHFFITAIPLKQKQYTIKGDKSAMYGNTEYLYAGCSTSADDGDVAEDFYYLSKHPKSCIEITHLDTIINRVEGTFEVYLAIEKPKQGEQNADKLCFKHGTFELDIIE